MRTTPKTKTGSDHNQLQKCLTGIKGFDEITEGGLPKNRITLLCGSTGTGKTLLGIDYLINGAVKYDEPGVFLSFEETEDELYKDVASLKIKFAFLLNIFAFQEDIVEHNLFLRNKFLQIKIEGSNVFIKFIFCLFE